MDVQDSFQNWLSDMLSDASYQNLDVEDNAEDTSFKLEIPDSAYQLMELDQIHQEFLIALNTMRILESKFFKSDFTDDGDYSIQNIKKIMKKSQDFFNLKSNEISASLEYIKKCEQILSLLDMLSIELNHLSKFGAKAMFKLYKSKNLHECEDQDLIDWFHFFCKVNSTLLSVASRKDHWSPKFTYKVYDCDGFQISTSSSLVAKFSLRIIRQLFTISESFYIFGSVKEKYFSTLILPCDCFLDIYHTCRSNLTEDEFWSSVYSIITNIIQTSKQTTKLPNELSLKSLDEAICFCWWLISQLSLTVENLGCQKLITKILMMSLSQCTGDSLLQAIKCYNRLVELRQLFDSYSLNRLDNLWKFFIKSMASFEYQWNPDEFSSPKDWNEVVDKLCHGNFILSTSFQHFLSLLIENIKEGSIWEQINEKFYSTFTSTSSNYHQNSWISIFTLFLVLTKLLSKNEKLKISRSCEKILSSVDWIEIKNRDSVPTILCGLFCLVRIITKRNQVFTVYSDEIRKIISVFSKNFVNFKNAKPEDQRNYWELICLYFRYLSDIINVSTDFSLGQIKLIPLNLGKQIVDGFRLEYSSQFVSIMQILLQSLKTHNDKFKSSQEINKPFSDFLQIISNIFIQFMQKFMFNCNLNEDFKEIVCKMASLLKKETFSQIWIKFGNECPLNVQQHSSYLLHFILDEETSQMLNKEWDDYLVDENNHKFRYCDSFMRGWFRCCLLDESGDRICSQMKRLNSVMPTLNVVRHVVDDENIGEITFEMFLKEMFRKYTSSKDFHSRVKWCGLLNRWCMPLVKLTLQNSIKRKYPLEAPRLNNLSSLVFHTSNMLYKNSGFSIIFEVLKYLVEMGNNKNILNSLKFCLHKFLLGVIEVGKTCSKVGNMIKSILLTYITLYKTSDNGQEHPILQFLRHAEDYNFVLKNLHHTTETNQELSYRSKVIEIIYKWSKTSHIPSESIDSNVVTSMSSLINQLKSQHHLSQTIIERLDFLLAFFKSKEEAAVIPSSLDLFS